MLVSQHGIDPFKIISLGLKLFHFDKPHASRDSYIFYRFSRLVEYFCLFDF